MTIFHSLLIVYSSMCYIHNNLVIYSLVCLL